MTSDGSRQLVKIGQDVCGAKKVRIISKVTVVPR